MHATYWVMPVRPTQSSLASVWSPWLRLPCSLERGQCWIPVYCRTGTVLLQYHNVLLVMWPWTEGQKGFLICDKCSFFFFLPPAPSLIQEKMHSFCTRPKVGRFSSRSRTSWGNMCFLLRRSVSGAQLLSVQTEFDWHSGSQDSEGITVMWWTLWWFLLLCDNPLKRCFLLIIRRLNSTTPNMLSLHRGGTHPGSWRTWRYVYCWPLTCELLLMEKKNTWKVHTQSSEKVSNHLNLNTHTHTPPSVPGGVKQTKTHFWHMSGFVPHSWEFLVLNKISVKWSPSVHGR